jgi:16S rRNA (adenine1518-N6/adenine1519-N6)-dimethyltransferase
VATRIVGLLQLEGVYTIVEIGPGRGALTGELIRTGKRVVAVETDPRLATYLSERFRGSLKMHQQDILQVDAHDLLPSGGARLRQSRQAVLVGNLPYNLSGPILGWIFDCARAWKQVVLTLQLEVVRRLIAEPATRDFGPLAVARALHFEAFKRYLVRPGAFFPPPRVMSAVVELRPARKPPLKPKDEDHFLRFVHVLFAHRRKNMRNNLKLGLHLDDRSTDRLFTAARVDGRRRAEQLVWAELVRLYGHSAECT